MWEDAKRWCRVNILRHYKSWKLNRNIKKGLAKRGRTE